MAVKNKTHDAQRLTLDRHAPTRALRNENEPEHVSHPAVTLERIVRKAPADLRPADIMTMQRTVGNRVVERMLGPQLPLRTFDAAAIQRRADEDETAIQTNSRVSNAAENTTGLPATLKAGIENLSGMSLDDVRVHRNSPKPAQVRALAYTQGAEIHLGPGEEKHLPHEAWHVVQQKQGRVRPTLQGKGLPINDDMSLEREADVMGQKAISAIVPVAQRKEISATCSSQLRPSLIPFWPAPNVIQRQTMEVDYARVNNGQLKKWDGWSEVGYKKKSITATLANAFQTNHIRDDVADATALAAIKARNPRVGVNTIYKKSEFDTAKATIGNHLVKQASKLPDVYLDVKHVSTKDAGWKTGQGEIADATDPNFQDDTKYNLRSFTTSNVRGSLDKDGTINIYHR